MLTLKLLTQSELLTITRSVHSKFNCIAVKYNGTRQSIICICFILPWLKCPLVTSYYPIVSTQLSSIERGFYGLLNTNINHRWWSKRCPPQEVQHKKRSWIISCLKNLFCHRECNISDKNSFGQNNSISFHDHVWQSAKIRHLSFQPFAERYGMLANFHLIFDKLQNNNFGNRNKFIPYNPCKSCLSVCHKTLQQKQFENKKHPSWI